MLCWWGPTSPKQLSRAPHLFSFGITWFFYMCMHWQDMGACWLHCRGPTHYASIFNSGFGSVLTLTSRSGEEPRLQTTNVWAWSAAHTSGKALWGWISLVLNHKCCAHVRLYKLVMPEREVVVCSADEGQQARNMVFLHAYYVISMMTTCIFLYYYFL